MTEATLQCPECGSTYVARGRLGHGRPGTFTPDGLRFWTLTASTLPLRDRIDPGSAALTGTAHACTACGLVWSHVDPERLRFVLRKAGTKSTRKKHDGSGGGEQQ